MIKVKGCPWAIVARLMHDKKSVRVLTINFAYLMNLLILYVTNKYPYVVQVTMNNSEHLCSSTDRVKTRMMTYH
jgi:hypothetical protein